MTETRAPFTGNPNSQHQRWSRWTFGVRADRKFPSMLDAKTNFARWCVSGFKTHTGRASVTIINRQYTFILEVEGADVHDPGYVEAVRRQFIRNFMHKGFGHGAQLTVFETGLLAGSREDGSPPDQLLVLPHLNLRQLLAEE